MAALAGECQQVFMPTVFTLHTGKAAQRVAAIQIPANNVSQIGSPEAVLPGEMVVIDLKKGLEMVLHTAVIIRILRISWAINSGRK
ncbi:MAG: hypothetical protein U9R20_01160 [Thermodesulfobacteriota bacterium]|nr:hypothetical protein [Thermodesulfobacteriota bacterium]